MLLNNGVCTLGFILCYYRVDSMYNTDILYLLKVTRETTQGDPTDGPHCHTVVAP